MKLSTIAAVGLALSLSACSTGEDGTTNNSTAAEPATVSDTQAVEAVEQAIAAGYRARDSQKVAAQFAETAIATVPGVPPLQGRAAIARSTAESVKDPGFSIDFTNSGTEVAASGDLAFTHGTYRLSFTDPRTRKAANQAGSYTTVFRKQVDGSWKVINDIATAGS